jgi:hypothetical protein
VNENVLKFKISFNFQVSRTFQKKSRMMDIWQVKLIMAYYNSPMVKSTLGNSALIHPEFLSHIKNRLEFRLDNWLKGIFAIIEFRGVIARPPNYMNLGTSLYLLEVVVYASRLDFHGMIY